MEGFLLPHRNTQGIREASVGFGSRQGGNRRQGWQRKVLMLPVINTGKGNKAALHQPAFVRADNLLRSILIENMKLCNNPVIIPVPRDFRTFKADAAPIPAVPHKDGKFRSTAGLGKKLCDIIGLGLNPVIIGVETGSKQGI